MASKKEKKELKKLKRQVRDLKCEIFDLRGERDELTQLLVLADEEIEEWKEIRDKLMFVKEQLFEIFKNPTIEDIIDLIKIYDLNQKEIFD